mgnify:CR=1 FL=1
MKVTQKQNVMRMRKETFEKMLYAKNLKQPLDSDKNKNTYLYYNNSGHVGSWENGYCWIFENKVLEDGYLIQEED